jgi:hypothetical protein
MRRRQFIAGLGAAAWPVVAWAQDVKRIGVLMNGATTDPKAQSYLATFVQGLRKLRWIDGQTLRHDASGAPVNFANLIADETAKWAKVVKFSGAKPDGPQRRRVALAHS